MTTYAEFLASLEPQPRDDYETGYEAPYVRRLAPDVRALAEAELLRRADAGDVIAFGTVAALGLREALPILERQAARGEPWAGYAKPALAQLKSALGA